MSPPQDNPPPGSVPVYARADLPDVVAPDGSAIRVLMDRTRNAARLSLAEATVAPGERTLCVSHRTIEEVWYILRGAGTFHQTAPDGTRTQAAVTAGDTVLIPAGHRFWGDNPGSGELIFLCCDAPGWPGAEEATLHDY